MKLVLKSLWNGYEIDPVNVEEIYPVRNQMRNSIVLRKGVSPNYCNNHDFVNSKFTDLCKKQYQKHRRAVQVRIGMVGEGLSQSVLHEAFDG
jgi:hypothetical protein